MASYSDTAQSTVSPGLIVVFSAPSGAGKTSVLHKLFERMPELLFSVSVTTRQPRSGERNGLDYHFISEREFDERIQRDEFVEWAEVHGHRYGTLKNAVDSAVSDGHTIILDTDTVGAFNIKRQYPHAVLIFIAPPSPEVLRHRLESRNTESQDKVEKRLSAMPREMRRMKEYDFIVVNNSLQTAVGQVESILTAEAMRSERVLPTLTSWRNYLE